MIFTHETVKDVTKLQQLEQAATEVVGRKEKTQNKQCAVQAGSETSARRSAA